jgi:hypothetical protein
MHAASIKRHSLSKSLGPGCSTTGLTLAGVSLLRQTVQGFVPRGELEIRWLLEQAYGSGLDTDRIVKGIGAIAHALNANRLGQAMIRTLLLDLTELDWAGAARLAQADNALEKFDPNQLRDERGRWAANGNAPVSTHAASGMLPRLSRSPLRLVSAQPENAPAGEPQQPADELGNPANSSLDDPEDEPWVRLPPGQRIDELGDLLEWTANAKPEEAPIIRGEIRRLYYDRGDTTGGNALNLALTNGLEADGTAERAAILNQFEPYTREDPSRAAMDNLGLTLGVGFGHDLAEALAGTPTTQWLDPDRGGHLFSSYFWGETPAVSRGTLLHEARSPRLASNFPIIDDEKAGVIIGTKTLDLAATGYQVGRRLRQVVNGYVKDIAEFNGETWGGVEIKSEEIKTRRLDLIIPRFSGNDAQWAILRSAIARAEKRGVHLQITEF